MAKKRNAIFLEGIDIYLKEGEGFVTCFHSLLFLGSVEIAALAIPILMSKGWLGPAYLFRVVSVAALALIVYASVRVANREISPSRFRLLRHWLQTENIMRLAAGQMSLLCAWACAFILLLLPLLALAAGMSRRSPSLILLTIALFFFYALTYGVWGLVSAAAWEERLETRQIFVRCVLGSWFVFSTLVYPDLNPLVFLLFQLGSGDVRMVRLAGAVVLPGSAVNLGGHLLILTGGVLTYLHLLRKGATLVARG